MHRTICIIISLILWLSVVVQLALMIENRVEPFSETLIRFFSFFTILTNLLCAIYFTSRGLGKQWTLHAGTLTAITTYIFIVGAVYQFVLRQIWEPTGLQKLVDEMLHSVNPILIVVFWFLYENKSQLRYGLIPKWLVFPLIYLLIVLIRGHFSGFYPYPFLHIENIGIMPALLNISLLIIVFIAVSVIFVFLARSFSRKNVVHTT